MVRTSYKMHSDANQSMLTDQLEDQGYQFTVAPNGVVVVEDSNDEITDRAYDLGGELHVPKKEK